MKLYICEKPSQGTDLANYLGKGTAKKNGFHYETSAGYVTWARGHLLELDAPEEYGSQFEKWTFESLPIAPTNFRISPKKDVKEHLAAISKLLKSASEVIISTDADREGEMIARELLDYYKYRGPIKRLWLQGTDPLSIQKAFTAVKSGPETEPLYHAALARSQADWLVGMNMTRAVTVRCRQPNEKGAFTIGRVQTPTLALVVRRDREIATFRPKDYFEIAAHTEAQGHKFILRYAPRTEEDRILDRSIAQAIANKAQGAKGPLKVEKIPKKTAPPRLFELGAFQKEANQKFGWGADKTLSIAQALYEKHKVTTYPRSDCDYLPDEQKPDVPIILAHLSSLPGALGAAAKTLLGTQKPILRPTTFNSSKVTAHHAIIPTQQKADLQAMTPDEKTGYLLIAGRYVENLYPDYEYLQTKFSLSAAEKTFEATGSTPTKPGWKAVAVTPDEDENDEDEKNEATIFPDLQNGEEAQIKKTDVQAKKTKAPDPYTEGTLLADMENIAKFVTDPSKKALLKEKKATDTAPAQAGGIGTKATRAAIIAKLCSRNSKEEVSGSPFIETKKGRGKAAQLISTQKGKDLIAILEAHLPALADPVETALWEEKLEAIVERKTKPHDFVAQIVQQIQVYLKTLDKGAPALPVVETDTKCPQSGKSVIDKGDFWSFPGFPDFYAKKTFLSRQMTLADYVAILTSENGVKYENLVGKSGKKFSAILQYSPQTEFNGKPGLEFKFS